MRHRPHSERMLDGIVLAIVSLIVFFISTTLAGLAIGDDQVREQSVGTPPRVLFVWHDDLCANSRRFFDDLDFGLRDDLLAAGWVVEKLDVRLRPLQAWACGVPATPCFVVPGPHGRSWCGYNRERFRELFGLLEVEQAEDQPPPPITAAEQLDREHLQQWIIDQFQQQRAEFDRQLAEIDQAEPATEQRLDEIRLLLDRIATDQGASSEMTSPAETPPPAAACPVSPPTSGDQVRPSPLASIVKLGGFSLTVLQALGLVGATSTGVGGVGVWLLLRFLNRRRQAASTPSPPSIVTMHSPPAQQAVYRDTTFVPVEVDTFAEAFAWAEVEIGRAYPGAVGNLQQIRSLITQYLASRGINLKPKR